MKTEPRFRKPETGPPLCLVGIGELLWDCFPHGKFLGGAPANLAAHAANLGAEAYLISAVGDDQPGQEAQESLKKRMVDLTHLAVDSGQETARVDVSLDAEGKATFEFAKSIPWDHLRWTTGMADLATRADLICFGTLGQRTAQSHETTMRFVNACRPDIFKLFDLNLRPPFYSREVIAASLEAANAIKLNEEELPLLIEMFDLPRLPEEEILQKVAEAYALDLIAYTKGSEGSLLYYKGELVSGKALATQVVDTVGAGDSFTATLLMGLASGADLARTSELANRVAAFVCGQAGATPELPTELLEAFRDLLAAE